MVFPFTPGPKNLARVANLLLFLQVISVKKLCSNDNLIFTGKTPRPNKLLAKTILYQ
ncbi:hypothetical protein DYBT9275_01909 [Dyadobacter sp. CECT 9275]|uniref:Uncharacterized protein n=1 Tax=Dyadobacter helix TaxID=2822344 RepID=A0A916NKX8_9BACT|nr:hypothetical protein DYBT9275_01909 [Dyadobacter sp. CECT 9275]